MEIVAKLRPDKKAQLAHGILIAVIFAYVLWFFLGSGDLVPGRNSSSSVLPQADPYLIIVPWLEFGCVMFGLLIWVWMISMTAELDATMIRLRYLGLKPVEIPLSSIARIEYVTDRPAPVPIHGAWFQGDPSYDWIRLEKASGSWVPMTVNPLWRKDDMRAFAVKVAQQLHQTGSVVIKDSDIDEPGDR